jgi:hypothetical protein
MNRKKCLLIMVVCSLSSLLWGGVALKSLEEEYWNHLVLIGAAERPTLSWRTLSDNQFTLLDASQDVWNLGSKKEQVWKFYGPEVFSSYNSAYPYGQNDGALWQGKGFNIQVKGGVGFSSHGFDIILKPEFNFSQNLYFKIMNADLNYESEYAYYWSSLDLPQRFGDSPFFTFDWGDSEIRYTIGTFTIGFGTQALWLGPGWLNAILHSNNAPTYPRLDFGWRKTKITIPWLNNWYAGDFELRFWAGRTGYSDYYKPSQGFADKHMLLTGTSVAYAPSFLPGLTLSLNSLVITPWEYSESWKQLFGLATAFVGNGKEEDAKAEISANWRFPTVDLEIYGSLGVDDYVPGGIRGYIRYPFHTMVYQIGLKKGFSINPQKQISGDLIFEWTNMEMSQDAQTQWAYNFYSHENVSLTNYGQLVGAGSGWAGNSQILAFKIYYSKGTSTIYIERSNPDNNYVYKQMIWSGVTNDTQNKLFASFKANFAIGAQSSYFLTDTFVCSGGLIYNMVLNDLYKTDGSGDYNTITLQNGIDTMLHNFRIEIGFSWKL